MSGLQQSFKNVMGWVDARLPVTETYEKHLSKYYAPKNFNFWYFFGVLSVVVLVNQLLTGIWLTMSYIPSAEGAFASVEYIMRDVEYGWMLRYMHSICYRGEICLSGRGRSSYLWPAPYPL